MPKNHKQFVIALFDKKDKKIDSKQFKEIDLNDLERYHDYEENADILKFTKMRIAGRTILELFVEDQISYWWFIQPTIYPKFNEAVLFIKRLTSFFQKNSVSILHLNGCFDKIDLIKQICNIYKITLRVSNSNYYKYRLNNSFHRIFKQKYYKQITEKKYQNRYQYYLKQKSKLQKFPIKDYALITGVNRRFTTQNPEGKMIRQESVLEPILNLISKNNLNSLCIDLDYTFKGTTEILDERLKTHFNWIPLEFLQENYKTNKSKSLEKLEKRISKHRKDIAKIFTYDGINLSSFMEHIFQEVFYEPYLPTYFRLITALEIFFTKNKPNVIIQVYETGPYAKAFQVTAKKFGVKTIGLAHAVISKDNANYTMQDIQTNESIWGSNIPELTLVFGKHDKEALLKVGYPNDKIAIIGHPQFYNIDETISSLNKNLILQKYHLEKEKIILIGISSYMSRIDDSGDYKILDKLYETFKDNSKICILLRPHPGDDLPKTNKILQKRYSAQNFKLSNAPLFEELLISDIVVTIHSSVGAESAFFSKPVFLVSISGNKANYSELFSDMIHSKLALPVTLEDLPNLILSILNDSSKVDMSNRNEFLKYYFNYGNSANLSHLIFNT